jgi:hypothetical protein
MNKKTNSRTSREKTRAREKMKCTEIYHPEHGRGVLISTSTDEAGEEAFLAKIGAERSQ